MRRCPSNHARLVPTQMPDLIAGLPDSALYHAGTITSLAAAWQLFRTCQLCPHSPQVTGTVPTWLPALHTPSVCNTSHIPATFPTARPTSRRFGGGSALLCPPRPWYLPLQLLPSPCSVPVTQLHRGPSARLVQICSQPPLSSHQSDPGHKQQRETTEPGSHTPRPWALAA